MTAVYTVPREKINYRVLLEVNKIVQHLGDTTLAKLSPSIFLMA